MKSFRVVLALGLLALSCSAYAVPVPRAPPPSCRGFAELLYIFGDKKACHSAVSVPEPATLGLLGIGLIGLAVKRRRK